MNKIKSILLVCTGNSCRSVMAEALLKKYLQELGKRDINIVSAGVHAIDGAAPTKEAIEVMEAEGIDVSGYRSRRLTDELINKADLILVMSVSHMDDIISRVPGAAPKVHMLKQYGSQDDTGTCESLDIADPIGQDKAFYEKILSIIRGEIKRIAEIL